MLHSYDFGLAIRGIPVVRDEEGRITVHGTVTHDLTSEGQSPTAYPLLAEGRGSRTVMIDLTGVPPGVDPGD